MILICLFLTATSLMLFYQTIDFDFVNYDDPDYITNNRQVQGGITFQNVIWAFTTTHAANWHPLTWLSHMLDVEIYGMHPGGHHATNLLFHIANSLLLFFIFKKMTGAIWPSAFIAAVFALHPLHVESVAWISERKDLLSAFFFLLTLRSYISYVGRQTLARYFWVVLFFALGLMSKPMLVTLPFVLLLMDLWPFHRYGYQLTAQQAGLKPGQSLFRLVGEKIPLFFLAALSSAITFYAQQHGGAVRSLETIPFSSRIANTLVAYVGYMAKMIFPAHLAFLYPHPVMIPGWKVGGAIFILALITLITVYTIKNRPYFFVGWFWFLGTLVPVIGLVQVGNQAMADRYTYIPLIGLFVVIAWGVSDLSAKWRYQKTLLAGIAGLVIVLFMGVTWRQAGFWKDSVTLFERAIKVTSDNFIAHYNLANVLAKQGHMDEAVGHYQQTISIKPNFADAYINLGNVYQMQGRSSDAMDQYLQALKLKPDNPGVHYNLGLIYTKQDDMDSAVMHFQKAIRLKPDYEDAYFKLGVALFQKNDVDGAMNNFEAVLRINPDNAAARKNLNRLLLIKKRFNKVLNLSKAESHGKKRALDESPPSQAKFHGGHQTAQTILDAALKIDR
jgi:protein O-mannosyl-transferase